MTAEEAIDVIKDGSHDYEAITEALALAVDALENQIPVKPISNDSHVVTWYCCSRCGKSITDRYDSMKKEYKYCTNCGQVIDWSEE